MNKNFFSRLTKIIPYTIFTNSHPKKTKLRHFFSSSQKDQSINHRFTYGQGGQFTFDLSKRTYSMTFQTIWEDHAELSYSGLSGQHSFFLTQNGKDVKMDDIDLEQNQREYVKIHSKIPEDYTIRGKINGSVHHLKNSVSSKIRSNPFELQILGYKNTYQWLTLECEDAKITNKNGEINIGSVTTKNATFQCEDFKSKKVLFSGTVNLKATNRIQIRSVVSYQDAQTKISESGDVYIESLSGKISTDKCKGMKIDRLLSCKDGIQIECDKIQDHIIVQSGSGTIQCLKQSRQVLKEKIKLGKMNKGTLDFDIYQDPNSPFSKVLVSL